MTATRPRSPEPRADGCDLAARLVGLYRNELDVYRRILALSRRQGELVRAQAGFADIRRVLEEKNRCLAVIARLERDEADARSRWERERAELPTADRGRVHRALQAVADVIEQILAAEEANDDELIRLTGVLA